MKTEIYLNASGWRQPVEFYDALLPKLKSPDWHGKNLNAIIDSVVYGEINEIEPPLTIRVEGLRQAPEPVRSEVEAVRASLLRARAERLQSDGVDRDIEFEIAD